MVGILQGLLCEESVTTTTRGLAATSVLQQLMHNVRAQHPQALKFCDRVVADLKHLLQKSITKTLPSTRLGRMWSSFHKYRFNALVLKHWEEVMQSIGLTAGEECDIAFQLVLDRCLKSLIDAYKKKILAQKKDVSTTMLTMRERNAIRYMAGYVAFQLKRRFTKKATNPSLQKKRQLFVRVLDGMQVQNEIEGITSVEDYTTTCVEITDRGGLYKINDKVLFVNKITNTMDSIT